MKARVMKDCKDSKDNKDDFEVLGVVVVLVVLGRPSHQWRPGMPAPQSCIESTQRRSSTAVTRADQGQYWPTVSNQ
jgi:hypothetical protein